MLCDAKRIVGVCLVLTAISLHAAPQTSALAQPPGGRPQNLKQALQGFFGARGEPASEEMPAAEEELAKPQSPRTRPSGPAVGMKASRPVAGRSRPEPADQEPESSRGGLFRGGIFHQLRAIGGQDDEIDAESLAVAEDSLEATEPSLEPFSSRVEPSRTAGRGSLDRSTSSAAPRASTPSAERRKPQLSSAPPALAGSEVKTSPAVATLNDRQSSRRKEMSAPPSRRSDAGAQPRSAALASDANRPRAVAPPPREAAPARAEQPMIASKRYVTAEIEKKRSPAAEAVSRSPEIKDLVAAGGSRVRDLSPLPDPISLPPAVAPSTEPTATASASKPALRASAATIAETDKDPQLTFGPTATPQNTTARSLPATAQAPSAQTVSTAASTQQQHQPKATVATGEAAPIASSAIVGTSDARLLEMVIPQIRLWVDGPPKLRVERATTYRVAAKNEGEAGVVGLLVSSVVPAGVNAADLKVQRGTIETESLEDGSHVVLWQLPELGPGEVQMLDMKLTASRAEHLSMEVEWTVLPSTGNAEIDAFQPQLAVALEGPGEVMFGKPEMYRMRVRNPGTVDLQDVEVFLDAAGLGSNRSSIGDLAAGKEVVVEVEMTFRQSGKLAMTGGASCEAEGVRSESRIEVNVEQVELKVACTAPVKQYQSAVAEYTFQVENVGSVRASGINCSVQLPPGTEASSLPEGVALREGALTWELSELAGGSVATMRVPLRLHAAGEQRITLRAEAADTEASADAVVAIESISDLKLTVVDPVAPAAVDSKVSYELIVHNRGSRPAGDVSIVAQFSDGIEPVSFDGGEATMVPGQVVFAPLASIAPGEQRKLRVVAVAAQPGMHRFRVEVKSEGGESVLVQEESTRFLTTAARVDAEMIVR